LLECGLMGRPYGSRTTILICCALAILLGRLAVLQYRWATGLATADTQREKEHLDSAASLFANEFNGMAAKAGAFLQNDASWAVQSGDRLTGVPKLIGELYSLDFSAKGVAKVKRLDSEGLFAPSGRPEWMGVSSCAPFAIAQPPALVAPFHRGRCFVARLDQAYLRDALFPQLILRSFGETVVGEYDFAVVSLSPPQDALYGVSMRKDLRKSFFPQVVAGVSHELRTPVAGFHVELALSPDLPAVFGDEKLLRTAIENLLSNAQKYAAGGHWIRVHTSYSAEQREVLISVEDRGAGIDPADQKEILEPFSRGRAAVAAQIPGSGIGLSLVRSAAEAHRGSVELVSKPGSESVFTMRLPV
jgi:hypothetical protein